MPGAFYHNYLKQEINHVGVSEIGCKLASYLTTFQQISKIEIFYGKDKKGIANTVADEVYRRFDQIFASKDNTLFDKKAPHIKLVILDRSYDMVTPVIHDYHYQACLEDLIGIDHIQGMNVEITDKNNVTSDEKLFINEEDEIWVNSRFQFIKEAGEYVNASLRDFQANNSTAKLQRGANDQFDLEQAQDIVKEMPEFQRLTNKYVLHIGLIKRCFDKFTEKKLFQLGEIEQQLVTS